jgi:hypothetical protein
MRFPAILAARQVTTPETFVPENEHPPSSGPGLPLNLAGAERPMLDILFISGGLAFFALAVGYAALCERL